MVIVRNGRAKYLCDEEKTWKSQKDFETLVSGTRHASGEELEQLAANGHGETYGGQLFLRIQKNTM